jgi:hypothetical protein
VVREEERGGVREMQGSGAPFIGRRRKGRGRARRWAATSLATAINAGRGSVRGGYGERKRWRRREWAAAH